MPASNPTAIAAMALATLCLPSSASLTRVSVSPASTQNRTPCGPQLLDLLRLGLGAGAASEIDSLAAEVATELADIRIVAVQKGDAIGGQRLDQFILGARNAADAVGKVLRMRVADIGDHAPVGRCDPGQRGNFAGVRHAHLNHGDIVCGLQLEQLQRQSEAIVQIALRFEHFEMRGQHGGDGVLGRGLAGAPGDGDDALAPVAANRRSQRLQWNKWIVFNDDQGLLLDGLRQIARLCCASPPQPGPHAPKPLRQSSWPSKRSPWMAKNKSPGESVRESIE